MVSRTHIAKIFILVSLLCALPVLAGPLHDAAEKGDLAEVKRLITAGGDINEKDSEGRTALFNAVSNGHREMVELLIENGANVNVKDREYSVTPLHWAAGQGLLEIAKLLVEKGADVNAQAKNGETPRDFAVKDGHKTVVKFLESKGALPLAAYKQRTLDGLGRFSLDKKVHIYETLADLSRQLSSRGQPTMLKSAKPRTLKEYSMLYLIDLDGDGKPDSFSIKKEWKNKGSWSYQFDLNNDGEADYIVYVYGFLIFRSKGEFEVNLLYYHWVDSNYDGRIDIWIYPLVDRNEDKKIDKGVYAWLFDTNGDGTIDKGEYAGSGLKEAIDIELKDGVFNTKIYSGDSARLDAATKVKKGDAAMLQFASKMLTEINRLSD